MCRLTFFSLVSLWNSKKGYICWSLTKNVTIFNIWIQQLVKNPAGLYLLFFTEMWERFSYYGMRAILIYYLTKTYLQGGLSIDPAQASLIYGYFTGFVYFTPLIGGWLADKFLGQRLSITIGGVLMMLGQFTLFAINTHFGLYIGLLLLIIGNGFFKPNISVLWVICTKKEMKGEILHFLSSIWGLT